MRRAGFAVVLLCLAGAGGLTASVVAGTGPLSAATDTTTTTVTGTTPTETDTSTTPTTTAPTTTAPKPRPKPKPIRLAQRVTIGGVHVGGLAPAAAEAAVRAAFRSTLVLRVGEAQATVSPARLGAVAYVKAAVGRARAARPGTAVPLGVSVRGEAVRSYVASLQRRFERTPVDSQASLRKLQPFLTEGRTGLKVQGWGAVATIVRALKANRRAPVEVPTRTIRQRKSRERFGPIVVIRRESKKLFYYQGAKLVRAFKVATGQASYPTPVGRFRIVVKWRNPWWYPPPSGWARGKSPVPPGPGNPLGTRWMGLSAPFVGIHGTPDAASLGYSASHGCIRMFIPSAEWLFAHVELGTPVFIVPA